MILKLIKTRPFISGCHCELWEINHVIGNRHLGDVFVLNEHLPLELIYPLTITHRGIYLQGRHCGWVCDFLKMEKAVETTSPSSNLRMKKSEWKSVNPNPISPVTRTRIITPMITR